MMQIDQARYVLPGIQGSLPEMVARDALTGVWDGQNEISSHHEWVSASSAWSLESHDPEGSSPAGSVRQV